MKTYKKIQDELDQFKKWIEDNERRYDFNRIAVNVKFYNPKINESNIDDFIDQLNINNYQKQFLKGYFNNPDKLYNIFDMFIEHERYYLSEFIGGCTINSNEFYEKLKEGIKQGKKTNYPVLDKKRSIHGKIKELEKWQKNDNKIRFYLSLINEEDHGFYGRSGGWFCFGNSDNISSLIDDSEASIQNAKKDDAIYYLKQIKDYVISYEWLIGEIKSMHSHLNISWRDELEFRISEILEYEYESV